MSSDRRRESASGPSDPKSCSPMRTVPAEGGNSPASSPSTVDLPAPDGPSNASNSPAGMSRSIPRNATTSPSDEEYKWTTPERWTSAPFTSWLAAASPTLTPAPRSRDGPVASRAVRRSRPRSREVPQRRRRNRRTDQRAPRGSLKPPDPLTNCGSFGRARTSTRRPITVPSTSDVARSNTVSRVCARRTSRIGTPAIQSAARSRRRRRPSVMMMKATVQIARTPAIGVTKSDTAYAKATPA